MAKANKRVVKYKAPININAGIVIFGIIFLYVAINLIMYFATDRVTYYEVVSGTVSDSSTHSYNGIALRKEDVFYADSAGYINYYVRESSRVSKNTTLYSMDESGRINDLLEHMTDEEKTLSDDNIATVKEELYSFVSNFNEMEFDTVYNFKSTMQGTVVELINMNALQSIYSSLGNSKAGQFEINKSGSSGIVIYSVDNYEKITPSKLETSYFDKSSYRSAKIESGDLIESGTPIYKTITQEDWSIAIKLNSEDAQKYNDTTALKIKFKKDGITVNTNFKIEKGKDGKKYGIFTLQKYLIRYASERFIDIEIVDYDTEGLKIPKKSLVNKEFFIIPVLYKTSGGDSNDDGFIIRKYDKSTQKDIFTVIPIAYEDEKYCYVAVDSLEAGDEIILPANQKNDTTSQIYSIKDKQSLTGVYNINNGYTQFVFIIILEETGDYYIVESQSKYGLREYDHIILNASMVKENQVIFQ